MSMSSGKRIRESEDREDQSPKGSGTLGSESAKVDEYRPPCIFNEKSLDEEFENRYTDSDVSYAKIQAMYRRDPVIKPPLVHPW